MAIPELMSSTGNRSCQEPEGLYIEICSAPRWSAFWDTTPSTRIEVDQLFRGMYCLHTLMVEAVCISETSVYFCETERRYIPEGCYLHTRRRGNLRNLTTPRTHCHQPFVPTFVFSLATHNHQSNITTTQPSLSRTVVQHWPVLTDTLGRSTSPAPPVVASPRGASY
jgi:hypothetical protein